MGQLCCMEHNQLVSQCKSIGLSTTGTTADLENRLDLYNYFMTFKKTELQKLCKEHSCKVSGTKQELAVRLVEKGVKVSKRSKHDGSNNLQKLTKDELVKRCEELRLSVKGTKQELISRIEHAGRLSLLTVDELKKRCSERNLKVSGTKAELISRLLTPQDDESPTFEKQKGKFPKMKIASWNIANLTANSKHKKYDIIADILSKFDVIAIQEVLKDDSLSQVMNILSGYDYVLSPPIGRTRKEHYAFLYKKRRVKLIQSGQFTDQNDELEREPFVATFRCGKFDFVLITVHILWGGKNPKERRKEIVTLEKVVKKVQKASSKEQDIIILGDFNFSPKDEGWNDLKKLGFEAIFHPPTKTTVGGQLYDNIWIHKLHTSANFTGKSGVVPFDDEIYKGDTLKARNEVSDHRPIWAEFRTDIDNDENLYGDLSKLTI